MDRSPEDVARAVLDRYGTTFAEDAGIALADEPAPLFQLLVLAELLSARIGAGIAVAAAVELSAAGWTTPQRMRDASRPSVIGALGRAGYRRYDERTATELREMAALVLDRYGGDLRRLADEADGDVDRAARLIQEVKGIGPTGRRRLPAGGAGRLALGAPVPGRPGTCRRPPHRPPRRRRTARRPGRSRASWPGSPRASSASRACRRAEAPLGG